MTIGVISDTHGDMAAMWRAVEAVGAVDMWLHSGDYSQDGFEMARQISVPVVVVQGNCDGISQAQEDEYIEVDGVRIWVTHGHRFGAKTRIEDLALRAAADGVQAVVYGHTHIPALVWINGILIFNPGSAARPRGGSRASCGLLEIGPQQAITARHIAVEKYK